MNSSSRRFPAEILRAAGDPVVDHFIGVLLNRETDFEGVAVQHSLDFLGTHANGQGKYS